VSTERRWAFVDASDEDGNPIGNLVQIDQKPRPFGGPGSWAERKRQSRIGMRISHAALAEDLGMTAADISAVERGEVDAPPELRTRWDRALLVRAIAIINRRDRE
jgi:hypothetical protein